MGTYRPVAIRVELWNPCSARRRHELGYFDLMTHYQPFFDKLKRNLNVPVDHKLCFFRAYPAGRTDENANDDSIFATLVERLSSVSEDQFFEYLQRVANGHLLPDPCNVDMPRIGCEERIGQYIRSCSDTRHPLYKAAHVVQVHCKVVPKQGYSELQPSTATIGGSHSSHSSSGTTSSGTRIKMHTMTTAGISCAKAAQTCTRSIAAAPAKAKPAATSVLTVRQASQATAAASNSQQSAEGVSTCSADRCTVQRMPLTTAAVVNAQVNAAVQEAADLYMARDNSGRPYWQQGRKPAASITAGTDNTKRYLQEGKVHVHSRFALMLVAMLAPWRCR
jgi:hypothetical protein